MHATCISHKYMALSLPEYKYQISTCIHTSMQKPLPAQRSCHVFLPLGQRCSISHKLLHHLTWLKKNIILLKTSIAPQKWWLEDVIFLLRRSIFRGYVSFWEGSAQHRLPQCLRPNKTFSLRKPFQKAWDQKTNTFIEKQFGSLKLAKFRNKTRHSAVFHNAWNQKTISLMEKSILKMLRPKKQHFHWKNSSGLKNLKNDFSITL